MTRGVQLFVSLLLALIAYMVCFQFMGGLGATVVGAAVGLAAVAGLPIKKDG